MKAMYPLMQKALDYNKLAADLGSAQAAYNLNHAYLGQGTTIADYNESLKWLRRANELGHPPCNDRACRAISIRLGHYAEQTFCPSTYEAGGK